MHSGREFLFLFLSVALLAVPSAGISAQTDSSVLAGRSLTEVLEEFRASGLHIIYSSDLVKVHMRVQAEPSSTTPQEIVAEILAPFGLGLVAAGDALLVIEQPSTSAAASLGALRGIVRSSSSTHERLSSVAIDIVSADRSSRTSDAGDFVIDALSPGRHRLIAHKPGYHERLVENINIEAGKTSVVVVELDPAPTSLEKMVVTSSQYTLLNEPTGSYAFLDRERIENLPDLGDEVLRATHRLPGTANGGISTKSHVRGGEEDETLVIFDGLRLYEPFHLKDFQSIFSTLDSRTISSIDFYSGGFPANYGDRMSAVMDITPERPVDARRYELGLSFFNASFLSSGTFHDHRGEWLVSARRGNLDLLIDAVNPDLGTPSYLDTLVQLRYQAGTSTNITLSGLLSDDKIAVSDSGQTEQADAEYQNHYLWLNISNQWLRHLSSETTLSRTRVNNTRSGFVSKPGINTGQLSDDRTFSISGLKQNWELSPSEKYLARWGIDAAFVEADYRYSSSANFEGPLASVSSAGPVISRDISRAPEGEQYAAYFTNRIQPVPAFTTELGLRWDKQTYTDVDEDQLSPRVSLLYKPAKRTELRASWGRFYQSQGIHELQVEDGVENFFAAQKSNHAIISLEHKFQSGLDLRVEAYRKNVRRLRPRFENLFNPLVLLPELEPDRVRIDPSRARVKGVEVLLASDQAAPLAWWVSYTNSSVRDKINDTWVARNWDQQHAVNFGVQWQADRWDLSLSGTYHSGWPTTSLVADPILNPDGSIDYMTTVGPRNGERFAPFSSLDFRATRRTPLPRGSLTYFVEVANLLNRKNPCCVEHSLVQQPDGIPQLVGEEEHWLPLIPSLGLLWEF